MEILTKDGVSFHPYSYKSEQELEEFVFQNIKKIFGSNAILLSKRKISTISGFGTIPDAFVIDLDNDEWFIIEVELAHHSLYNHIVPQISKFHSSLSNPSTHRKLVRSIYDEIKQDYNKKGMVVNQKGTEIYKWINDVLETRPEVVIIIDDKNKELKQVTDALQFRSRVLIFQSYLRSGLSKEVFIHQLESLKSRSGESFSKKNENMSANRNQKSKKKASSPSPQKWASNIEKLSNKKFNTWKSICEYLDITVGQDSARRVLKKWVKQNKPEWPEVPSP